MSSRHGNWKYLTDRKNQIRKVASDQDPEQHHHRLRENVSCLMALLSNCQCCLNSEHSLSFIPLLADVHDQFVSLQHKQDKFAEIEGKISKAGHVNSVISSSVLTVLMDVRGRVMPVITAAQELIFRTVAGGEDCQLLRAEWEEDLICCDVIQVIHSHSLHADKIGRCQIWCFSEHSFSF